MSAAAPTYYLTTPIYYVNDSPHIGHAYTSLACDVLARFLRLDGQRVHFLTGTDEHGQKVEKAAIAARQAPQAFTDAVSQRFRALGVLMEYSNDDFIRTTEPRHTAACQQLWRAIKANGHLYLGKYAGWYSVRDEAFYAEDELRAGPDGRRIAPSGAPVEWVEEPSYFFDLSKWQERLLRFYDENPDFIAPESRRNEVVSFVRGGLQDLSVSRTSFSWGVPVPDDPAHIMYVWLDALTNYLTAAGYPETGGAFYRSCWPAALHMVGKDIVRFHAVYWPAFLMAAGVAPPRRVFAHGWWTNEGQKISKSLGNVIDPFALVEKYGLDQVRYFLLREVPFGNDGDFSHAAIVRRSNADLANDYGNLVQRVLSMINRNCAARVPANDGLNAPDRAFIGQTETLRADMRGHMLRQEFHLALERHAEIVAAANRYVDEQAPWGLRKTDPARMNAVLYTLAETIRRLAVLSQPFMPRAAGRILDQLGVPPSARAFATAFAASAALVPDAPLPAPSPIFPRYVEAAA
jgi:methionyl-tRNA synthetase